jgi:acetyltransferase-like isoleucine patch superfamily enzyme
MVREEKRMARNGGLMGRFLASPPMRALVRGAIAIGRNVGRMASYSRARALFPDAPDVVCHWSTEVKCPQNVSLGKRVVIGTHCTIGAAAPIYLGDDVLLSKGVFIDTGTADISTSPPYAKMARAIRIERGVWLGAYSMVLAGVTIGENSVVAAGVIVRKSVAAGSFVVDERPRVQSFGDQQPSKQDDSACRQ